jgi:pimeloyl-ACP methyl ester carboxylesterase
MEAFSWGLNRMKTYFLLLLAVLTVGPKSHAGTTESGNHLTTHATAKASSLIPGIFQQNIDHTGLATGQTFNQRYWTDSEFANSPASPIIYHICGEGACDADYFLHDNAIQWAKSLGARLVYLEHRDYGQSIPGGDLASSHIQYLTLNNVLEDLATFQKSMTASQGWTGKWICVGGSYSGTISALYRQAHPELVVGALAASAPMIAGLGQSNGDASSDVSDLSYIDPSNDSGERPWAFQACTTFGFWEAQGSRVFYPSQAYCKKAFPGAPYANILEYNQKYNAPFIANHSSSPSNILFSYGSSDVWTKIGLSTQINLNPNISILVIPGAGHHYDLNPPSNGDSAAVKAARNQFLTLARSWLSIP